MKHLSFSLALLLAACGSNGGDDSSNTDGGNNPDGGMQGDGGGKDSAGGDGSMGNDGSGNDGSMNNDGSMGGAIQTVFIILFENHNWSEIKGSGSAPYINGTLLKAGAHAENYKTPPGNHPSEPNYIWLEAGDNLGITNDNDPSSNHQSTPDHLVNQLVKANISWKAYAEDIDGKTCPLTGVNQYAPKHTPQVFFDDVTDTNKTNSQNCIQHVRPYTELANDLKNNTVARYNFLTPNLCNDMHGETLGIQCNMFTTDLIKLGDTWLSKQIPIIQASSAYTNNGAIFIVWDEGSGVQQSDGPVGMMVLSPKAKAGYSNNIAYTHSSTLRTMETIFGVPLLRDAQKATDLSDLFTSFP